MNILKRISNLLQFVYYYGAYKFMFIHAPFLGYLLKTRDLVKFKNNITQIAGINVTYNNNIPTLGLVLQNITIDTLSTKSHIINTPLITNDNIIMIPIYNMQSVNIAEPNNDFMEIRYDPQTYYAFNRTIVSGEFTVSYLESMTMTVSRLHYIWLKYLNTVTNNEYYVFINKNKNLTFNYYQPYANIYIFNFSPDLKLPLNIYEFIGCFPNSDIAVHAINGAINDADLQEFEVTYKYNTIRRHIITDLDLQNLLDNKKESFINKLRHEKLYKIILTDMEKFPNI